MLFGVNSHPQLIWADAVYVLSKHDFIRRLQSHPTTERFNLLAKFLVVLLGYGFHDYAYEIIDASQVECSLSTEIVQDLKHVIHKSILSPLPYSLKSLTAIIVISVIFLITFPIPSIRKRVSLSLRKHSHNYLCWAARNLSRGGFAASAISDKL